MGLGAKRKVGLSDSPARYAWRLKPFALQYLRDVQQLHPGTGDTLNVAISRLGHCLPKIPLFAWPYCLQYDQTGQGRLVVIQDAP